MNEKLKRTTQKAKDKAKELCKSCEVALPYLALFATSAIASGVMCVYEVQKRSNEAYIRGFKDCNRYIFKLAKDFDEGAR